MNIKKILLLVVIVIIVCVFPGMALAAEAPPPYADISILFTYVLFGCGLLLLLKWIASKIFKTKPKKYVFYINPIVFITLNIILFSCYFIFRIFIIQTWMIISLFIVFSFIEIVFYLFKYREIRNINLFLLVGTTNAIIFVFYWWIFLY